MLLFYEWFFPCVWIAFMLYWQIKSSGTKATQRLEPLGPRIVRALAFVIAIALFFLDRIPLPWLYRHFLPGGLWTFWTGAAVTVGGLLFAVWARQHLGGNWSRSVTIKENHQLITTGPYAFVRHPIYTGILTGFVGSVIAQGQMRGIVSFLLVFAVLWYKLRMEEQWMRGQFGTTYEMYCRHVAALVPFIL